MAFGTCDKITPKVFKNAGGVHDTRELTRARQRSGKETQNIFIREYDQYQPHSEFSVLIFKNLCISKLLFSAFNF